MEEPNEQKVGLITERKSTTGFIQRPSHLWKWSTCVLALIAFFQLCLIVWLSLPPQSTYETGFSTDLDDATSSISLEQVRFTNPIRADDNGFLYMFNDSSGPIYTGPPSKEIDQAWDNLTEGRYILFNEDEVARLNQDKYLPPLQPLSGPKDLVQVPGFYGGIDMMHSLHCLNMLRKQAYPDYYHEHKFPVEYMQMHLEHCIDQLRQSIMCSGDMTPVSLRPIRLNGSERYNFALLGETERVHTCRNYTALQEWVRSRGRENRHVSGG